MYDYVYMAKYGFLSAFREAQQNLARTRAEERNRALTEAVRSEITAIFNNLPEQRKLELIASILSKSEIDENLLRRFVQVCPTDKYVEITFPKGETIVISGSALERRGPGW